MERRTATDVTKTFLKKKDLPSETWGANWLVVRRFNLETGEDTCVLDVESLHLPTPYTRGWVSQLLSVSPDASAAVCVVGLCGRSQIRYYVYELSFAEGLQRRIAELPHVFL